MHDFQVPNPSTILSEGYLWMPRREAPEGFEQFLEKTAQAGFLLIGVAEDSAAHGDPQFLQTRRAPGTNLPPEQYWQQHGALHQQLRSLKLRHLPVGLGPEPTQPLALAWLVPAPEKGLLQAAAGFEQTVGLTNDQADVWLDWAASQLAAGLNRPAQRLLLQPPGHERPAVWHYGSYRGDAALSGPLTERVRTLLAGLPRYALDASTPAQAATPAEAGAWPLLLNKRVNSVGEAATRSGGHLEIF